MAFNRFVLLVALLAVALPGKAIVAGRPYQMQSFNPKADVNGDFTLGTGNCWTAASNHNGAAVTLQKCKRPGKASQSWTFSAGVPINGGTSAVGTIKIFGNKCLTVKHGIYHPGTKLQIRRCEEQNQNQKWQVTNGFAGVETIKLAGSTKCIDLTGGDQSDGTPIRVSTCADSSTDQKWISKYASPTPISDGSNFSLISFLQPAGSRELCLTAGDSDLGFDLDVVDMTFCDHFEQGMNWLWEGGSLKVFGTNLCLSVTNNVNANGTPLTTQNCVAGDQTQQWKFNRNFSIQWVGTDKCINLTDGNLAHGTKLQIWTCSRRSTSQKWEISPIVPN